MLVLIGDNMKEFLKGLPIVIAGIILFFIPYMLFGEVGMNALLIIIAICALCCLAWAIGDMIINR